VFKFHPQFTLYKWTGKNDYFILSNAQHLAMGGTSFPPSLPLPPSLPSFLPPFLSQSCF